MLAYIIIFLCIVILLKTGIQKGFEETLAIFCFIVIFMPDNAEIKLGFLDLNARRASLITLMILFSVHKNKRKFQPYLKNEPLKYLIIISIGWNLISALNSVVPIISVKRMLSYIIEYYILYFIFIRTISKVQTVNKILVALVTAIVCCSLMGAIEAYTDWAITDWFPYIPGRFEHSQVVHYYGEGRGDRIKATFPHAILFGDAIVLAIPIALYLLTLFKNVWKKVLIWLGIMLMFLCIYKTMSRGAWLSLALSFILLFLLGKKEVRKYILIIGILTLTTLLLRPGVWETVKGLFFATFDTGTQLGSSYEYRYSLIQVAREALSQDITRQIWGFGQGSFFYLELTSTHLGRTYQFLSCDSTWILFMIEFGYVGLLIMIMLLGKAALLTWKNYRHVPKPNNDIFLLIFINLAAFYLIMTNVSTYGWGQNGHFLWILISVSIAYGRVIRTEQEIT